MNREEKEQKALALIEQGDKDSAVTLLFELITEYANDGDFTKADSLRELLIQTNAMALSEIVKSGELLEELKLKAISPDHKERWKLIYDSFSAEETTAFYFALKTINLQPGKLIIQQGKLNDKLFFINSGQLKSIYHSGAEEVFLKESTEGEVIGFSTFFSISLATTSVMTDSAVSLSYLTRKSLKSLKESIPGFDNKIEGLCKKLVTVHSSDIIQQQNLERRKHERFPVKGKVATFVIGADGKPREKPFYGSLEDLSCGGVSYLIKASSKESARILLGRTAMVKILTKKGNDGPVETKKGRVTGLHDQLFNNYSISFKFLKPLSEEALDTFLS